MFETAISMSLPADEGGTIDRVFNAARRRWRLGVAVLIGMTLLQIGTEFLNTHDSGRFAARAVTLAIGLPLLTIWGFAVFRWASRRSFGVLGPLFVGAVVSGLVFGALLWATRLASDTFESLRNHYGPWGEIDVLRIGFGMGVQNFAIWALAFIFPFAVDDARFRALEADKLRTQAELAQLRSNLEPHFLLNTLNAIAGLVTEDPRKACNLLGSLGDLLRDSMTPEGEMQPLEQQLNWLRRYAHILEERHAGQLVFHWEINPNTRRALLPRLLLQPLVENAVKHGALMRKGGGEITIRTELAAGGKLVCTIEDNGPGVSGGAVRPGAFGLLSVRRRLSLRYSSAGTLTLDGGSNGTRAVVEVPLEEGGA